jgi:hypothetical protein
MLKKLKSLFKKQELPAGPCLVHIIDADARYLNDQLGITDKRHDDLVSVLKDKGLAYEMLAEVSKHCNHPNELAYICFKIGHAAGKTETFDGLFDRTCKK